MSPPNAQTQPTLVTVRTIADITAPVWPDGYPTIADIADVSCTVTVASDEPGSAFYVVLPQGAPTPSPSQLRSGVDSNGSPTLASGSIVVTEVDAATSETGVGASAPLAASTQYDVYVDTTRLSLRLNCLGVCLWCME